jgi:hypothetical protein
VKILLRPVTAALWALHLAAAANQHGAKLLAPIHLRRGSGQIDYDVVAIESFVKTIAPINAGV